LGTLPRMMRRTLATLLGVGIAVLAGELLLRAGGYETRVFNPLHSFHEPDPEIGRRGKPGVRGRFRQLEFDVQIEHDARGFRKHLHPAPAAAEAEGQVLVVGDSFVWGWGVAPGESVSDQLARLLPDRRVRNLGLTGSGTARQYALFEREVPELGPDDEVLLLFFGNDFSDDLSGRGSVRFDARGVPRIARDERSEPALKSLKEDLKEASYLFGFLAFQLDRLRGLAARARGASSLPDPALFREDGPERTLVRHFLARFVRRAGEAGAGLSLVFVPGAAELGEDDDPSGERLRRELGLRAQLEEIAAALRITQVDVRPALRSAQRRDGPVFIPGDGHWNANGHAAVASALASELRARRSNLPEPLLLE